MKRSPKAQFLASSSAGSKCAWFLFCALTLAGVNGRAAEDFVQLCADRAAIERVYYHHRLGDKPPFEQTLPPAAIEQLVRQDLAKEAALREVYGVEVTPGMLEAEAQRIHAATRAPDVLAELEAALGNDTNRFARIVARPILVERLLREKFENDDPLHAPQRREIDQARERLLSARKNGAPVTNLLALLKQARSNAVSETTWQLGARPAESTAPDADELEVKQRFGPGAKLLSGTRGADQERKVYFSELPRRLQEVLRAQLRQPGDVSAVIETASGFLLFLATDRGADTLSVASLSIPKRSYEAWLAEQAR
jgi:hypothetical protein